MTVSLNLGWKTVSVVLAVAPIESVAVMVVVPGPAAVARPAALIVATDATLLVHVTPAVIATGTADPVVVPLPN